MKDEIVPRIVVIPIERWVARIKKARIRRYIFGQRYPVLPSVTREKFPKPALHIQKIMSTFTKNPDVHIKRVPHFVDSFSFQDKMRPNEKVTVDFSFPDSAVTSTVPFGP